MSSNDAFAYLYCTSMSKLTLVLPANVFHSSVYIQVYNAGPNEVSVIPDGVTFTNGKNPVIKPLQLCRILCISNNVFSWSSIASVEHI